ncbi:MAG: hypothetical protein MHM6MM_002322 [Cercozoa sp. M6MM]
MFHGDVKSENVLLTTWHWLMLCDGTGEAYKPVRLPADNPADFHFFFAGASARRRCYVAPERFEPGEEKLTSAMDIFSVGCVICEVLTDGKALFDLPKLLAYKDGTDTRDSVLNSIEDAALRDLVRDMTQRDPAKRKSALEYWSSGIADQGIFPRSFNVCFDIFRQLALPQFASPDSRIKTVAKSLGALLHRIEGYDLLGAQHQHKSHETQAAARSKSMEDAFIRQRLESMQHKIAELQQRLLDNDDKAALNNNTNNAALSKRLRSNRFRAERPLPLTPPRRPVSLRPQEYSLEDPMWSEMRRSKSPIQLFATLICVNVRSVQHDVVKLRALQSLSLLAPFLDSDAALNRVLPYVVALLGDASALVRCGAVSLLTDLLRSVVVTPTAAEVGVLPDYVLPALMPLADDPDLCVRVALARDLGRLAEQAMRILHCDRVALARQGVKRASLTLSQPLGSVDVAKLRQQVHKLVQQLVSRAVSGDVQRALLCDFAKLCRFYGRENTADELLPLLTTVMNSPDWSLRASFLEALTDYACSGSLGRHTLRMLLPVLENGLCDSSEYVVQRTVDAFSRLCRAELLDAPALDAILARAAPLVCHPNAVIRCRMHSLLVAMCDVLHFVPASAIVFRRLDDFLLPLTEGETRLPFRMTRRNLAFACRLPLSRQALQRELSLQTTRKTGLLKARSANEEHLLVAMRPYLQYIVEHIKQTRGQSPQSLTQSNRVLRSYSAVVSLPVHGRVNDGSFLNIRNVEHALCTIALASHYGGGDKAFRSASSRWLLALRALALGVPLSHAIRILRGKKAFLASGKDLALALTPANDSTPMSIRKDALQEALACGVPDLQCSRVRSTEVSLKKMQPALQLALGAVSAAEDLGKISVSHMSWSAFYRNHAPPYPSESKAAQLGPHFRASAAAISNIVEGAADGESSSESQDVPLSDWRPQSTLYAELRGHGDAAIWQMAVSRDNSFMASAGDDGKVAVWPLGQLDDEVRLSPGLRYEGFGQRRVPTVCVLDSSLSVAAADETGRCHVFKVNADMSHTPLREFNVGERGDGAVQVAHVHTVSESLLVVALRGGVVRAFDLRSRLPAFALQVLPTHGNVTCMCLPAPSLLVVGTSRGFVMLWDLRFRVVANAWRIKSGHPIAKIWSSAPGSGPGGFAAQCYASGSPEETPLLFVSAEGTSELCVFDMLSGEARGVFRCETHTAPAMPRRYMRAGIPSISYPLGAPSEAAQQGSESSARTKDGSGGGSLGGDVGGGDNFTRLHTAMHNLRPFGLWAGTNTVTNQKPVPTSVSDIVSDLQKPRRELGTVNGFLWVPDQFAMTAGTDRIVRLWSLSDTAASSTRNKWRESPSSWRVSGEPPRAMSHVSYSYLKGDRGLVFEELCAEASDAVTLCQGQVEEDRRRRGPAYADAFHADVITDMAAVEFPRRLVLTSDRAGVVKLWC